MTDPTHQMTQHPEPPDWFAPASPWQTIEAVPDGGEPGLFWPPADPNVCPFDFHWMTKPAAKWIADGYTMWMPAPETP